MRIKRRDSILIFLSLPKQKGKKNLSLIVEEEEVVAEVEAVQAVYGDDCMVLQSYPPHVHLLLKPHTADVTSQQVSFSLSLLFSIFVWLPRKRWKVKPKPRKDKRKTVEIESKDHTFCFTQVSVSMEKRKKKKKSQNLKILNFDCLILIMKTLSLR